MPLAAFSEFASADPPFTHENPGVVVTDVEHPGGFKEAYVFHVNNNTSLTFRLSSTILRPRAATKANLRFRN